MKTPEQIAAEIIERITMHGTVEFMGTHDHGANDLWAAIAVKAIEADRVQREFPMSDPVVELREWASTVSQLMAEDKSNDWSEEIAHLQVIEERLDA